MIDRIFISICIPAYKNEHYLKRLLDSIAIQDYKDFEVIISDDSPDNNLVSLISNYSDKFSIRYIRNEVALGSPANWNNAIKHATGEWIKIMHDDDWFAGSDSLGLFADVTQKVGNDFIFCSYNNYFLDENKIEFKSPPYWRLALLRRNPKTLISQNIIGPPSVTMHRNDGRFFYDNKLKWLVDIDFYIDRLSVDKLNHIKKPLINVGMSTQQVTVSCFGVPSIEIPEYFHLMSKKNFYSLKSLLIYDSWWRLVRNLEIASYEKLLAFSNEAWPVIIKRIIFDVNRFPKKLLRIGIISKLLMFLSYLWNKRKIVNESIRNNN